MAVLQSEGVLKLSEIAAHFGGSPPHRLSEYYKNGSYVNSQYFAGVGDTLGTLSASTYQDISGFEHWWTASSLYWEGTLITTSGLGGNRLELGGWYYHKGTEVGGTGFYRVARQTISHYNIYNPINSDIPVADVLAMSDFYGGDNR